MPKKIIIRLLFICFTFVLTANTKSQTILNGDFENNTAPGDIVNSSPLQFNTWVADCNSFGTGPGGSMGIDIFTTAGWGGPPEHGNWYLSMHGAFTDQLSMKLSAPLVAGNSYTLSFYDRAWWGWPPSIFEVGVSTTNNTLGTVIYTIPSVPPVGTWVCRTCTFIAPNNGQYITINVPGIFDNYTQIDNFTLSSQQSSLVNLGNDTTLCSGQQLILDATYPSATYLWQDNSVNPTYTVSQQGTYWVQVTGGCAGTSKDTINVNYMPLPTVHLVNDTTLCEGKSLTLDATTTGVTYLWQDNSTGSAFNVSQQGIYWVQVKNGCSNTSSDTVNVNYNLLPIVHLGNDTSFCEGDQYTLDATTIGATYLWQDNSANPTYNTNQSGNYWVQVTTNGCSSSDSVAINYIPYPVVDFGNDTTLCQVGVHTLDVTTVGATYLWQDNSINSTINVSAPGIYWVEVTTGGSCSAGDTINIEFEDCDCYLYMPNSFTPNNDNKNDTYLPVFDCKFKEYHLLIFDRWGEKMFETSDWKFGWDGTYKNEKVSLGVYSYELNYTSEDGKKKQLIGRLSLIR